MARAAQTSRNRTFLLLALGAALLAGCAPGSPASRGVAGGAILTLESPDAEPDSGTMTRLALPLPDLEMGEAGRIEWSQVELASSAGWSTGALAALGGGAFAVAGPGGVEVVRTVGGQLERAGGFETEGAIASVSHAGGVLAALSADGSTLHLLSVRGTSLEPLAGFPLDAVVGAGAGAAVALLSPDGSTLATLRAGDGAVSFFRVLRSDGGGFGLRTLGDPVVTGANPVAGAWTSDGARLVVADRMWDASDLEGLDVAEASGRLSVITPPSNGDPARAAHLPLPMLPRAVAIAPGGARALVALDGPAGAGLALVSLSGETVSLLGVARIDEPVAAVAFDARGGHALTAHPASGVLRVWRIEGNALVDTEVVVETGGGVGAALVAP